MASDSSMSMAWVFDLNNCRGPTGVTRHALAQLDRLIARPEIRLTVVTGRVHEPDGLAFLETLSDRPDPPRRRELPISMRNALRAGGWSPGPPSNSGPDGSTGSTAPANMTSPPSGPGAVTSHDILQDIRYGSERRLERLGRTFQNANKILSVSQFNTKQLLERFPDCQDKVAIVPNAADDLFFEPTTEAERSAVRSDIGLNPGQPFLLSVANFQPRKNLPRLVRAAGRLPEVRSGNLAIVFIGEGAESQSESIRAAIATIGPRATVVLPGYRQGPKLRALYAEASALVFPSTCESFGIPAVEAMAQGCPVALADSTALPEVGGEAGWYFDPEKDDAITTTLRDLIDRSEDRERRIQIGRSLADTFRWDHANDCLLAALRGAG